MTLTSTPSLQNSNLPVRAFVSYAHADAALKDKFDAHTSLLKREQLLDSWHDGRISAGLDWEPELLKHLETAELVVLLISAEFIRSEYCWTTEMLRSLERHEQGMARVIPVILKPVDWQTSPFAKLQALPKNGKPVTSWDDRDAAFRDIAAGIRRAIIELRTGHNSAASMRDRTATLPQVVSPVRVPPAPIVAVPPERVLLEISVESTIQDVEQVRAAIIQTLLLLTGDVTLKIRTLREGSVTIVLDLTREARDRLQALIEAGELTALEGFPIIGFRVPLPTAEQEWEPTSSPEAVAAPDVRSQTDMGRRPGYRHTFTSESVTEGHPDKMADQISDAVLDAVLTDDPTGRVACEVLITTGLCFVAGEITTTTYVDVSKLAREVIADIGFTDASYGFDAKTCGVLNLVQSQSPDIALGVDTGGAGDQGMMFGYACNETPELMPLPIMLSHKLVARLSEVRRSGELDFLRPDGKSQVSVEYVNGEPVRVDAVVISTQHHDTVTSEELREKVRSAVIVPVIPANMIDAGTKFHINPTGRFVVGGPHGDTGLTGRKIIVDTYGGMGRHGGGAFSGKDPTKVDRSASYMARYIAKNIVASGYASRCEVQLAYAIGVADPVSISVNTFGTNNVEEYWLTDLVPKIFPLTPKGIIEHLQLRRPIYRQTAAFGHFGRSEPTFTWEALDKVDLIREYVEERVGVLVFA